MANTILFLFLYLVIPPLLLPLAFFYTLPKCGRMIKEFWDHRYDRPEYIYGVHPNAFFRETLDGLLPGKILLPAEGEGRNAVYAAQRGWEVFAFDQSEKGFQKAQALASKNNVKLNYLIADALEVSYAPDTFDVIAMIFSHFPLPVFSEFNKRLISWMKIDGMLIMEGFSKRQVEIQALDPKAGGPRDSGMLWDEDMIRHCFRSIQFHDLVEKEIILQEGLFHSGPGLVIDAVGRKA